MKYLLLPLAAIIFLVSCEKKPNNTTTYESQLRGGKWTASSGTITVKLPSGADTIMKLSDVIPACYKDDYLMFDSLYTGGIFASNITCSPGDPASQPFNWQITNNNSVLNFYAPKNIFFRETPAIQAPYPDTLSLNPMVVDTVYKAAYSFSIYDTSQISANLTAFSSNSFTISYQILSTYLDTTVSHAYKPVLKPDTVSYTVTYTKS